MRQASANTVVRAAAGIVSRLDTERKKLLRVLKPFAEIALERDSEPTGEDRIAAVDLAITVAQVRAARRIMQETE